MAEPCDSVRDLIPELALGVAAGDQRAFALKHLATCAECRAMLEETTAIVDELMLLAPEQEPPPGFEGNVLAAIESETPRPRPRTVSRLLAAAAVVLVAAMTAAVTRWADSDDRRLAEQYRQTLEVADGSYLRATDLIAASGEAAGHVFAYEGEPSWIFMTVDAAPTGDYGVILITDKGQAHSLGTCWVRNGHGSWGTAINVPVSTIDRLEMRTDNGTTFTASLAGSTHL